VASQETDESEEAEADSRDFLTRQGAMFAEGFSFSGFERDLVALNRGDGTFVDISGVSGADSVSDGRAAVFADLDNDGDLYRFLRAMHGPAQFLFRNEVGHEAGWLRISLDGTESGRDAWGAVVRVKTSRGVQTKVKSGGAGFLSQSDPRLLFGLGDDPGVDWIEVSWPSGRVERLPGAPAGRSLRIVEGENAFQRVTEVRFSLPDPVTAEARRWQQFAFKRGDRLPALAMSKVGGGGEDLGTLIGGGRVTLVNFWATWCVPCRTEMPELEKLHQAAGEAGLRVIGISVDRPQDHAAIPAFVGQTGISYPIYTAEHGALTAIFSGTQAPIPSSLVIDEEGRVVEVFTGWSREVKRHLDELGGSAASSR